jgi:hypothetical protein
MSTQQRVDSSRANGAKSRGPVTPEGRARSRAARLTHGLTSADLLINGESQEEFNAFREEYLADYQPQTRPQFDLVDQLVATRWRLNRVIALQNALMDIQMIRQQPEIDEEFESCDGGIRAAIAYQHLCDDSRGLESLHRHEARLSAEFRRTFKLLAAELKNQKFHHEPSPAETQHSEEDGPAGSMGRAPLARPEDDPTAEAPPIPPNGSTGDVQPATSEVLERPPSRQDSPRGPVVPQIQASPGSIR